MVEKVIMDGADLSASAGQAWTSAAHDLCLLNYERR